MYTESVSFLDNCNTVIFSCKMKSLPITEEGIISKSIEFFNDPEPCFIHRGAVITRIIAEIDDYFKNIAKKGIYEILWADFPEKFKSLVNAASNIYSVRFL